jgi:quercetin dioxygenase-like cupin family protein
MKNEYHNSPAPPELNKGETHIIVENIEYLDNAIVSKTIIRKSNGSVTATSVDEGETLRERIEPCDTYIQIIDGAAEITIDDKKHFLKLGEGIVIPAYASHKFHANEQFKMIATHIETC